MKVVLFCGGQGLRLRGYGGIVPKPIVHIGYRPILWHVMKYYAHFGHTDFILCLGHYGEVIRKYFLDHQEYITYDFVLRGDDRLPEPVAAGPDTWNITLVDTGLHACIGERLMAVRSLLADEEYFLANYADGVTDLQLPTMIDDFSARDAVAGFLNVQPHYSFHVVNSRANGTVETLLDARAAGLRINGGYFIFRGDIFDYMRPGEELIEEPFQRLIRDEKLVAYEHNGFWGCIDTFKEKSLLEGMHLEGRAPWEFWRRTGGASSAVTQATLHYAAGDTKRSWGRETFSEHWGEHMYEAEEIQI